jgi:hypothetical protein
VRGQENQFKTVRQLINAVFDGNACHGSLTP